MNKVYAFSGTQSTGKTTIIENIKVMSFFADYKFYSSITRKAKSRGVQINTKAGKNTQDEIIDEYLKTELSNPEQNCIVDRCLLDTYAYTLYFWKKGIVESKTLDRVKVLFDERCNSLYEHIFITYPDFDNVLDGVREDNNEFRMSVHDCLIEIAEASDISHTILKGSNEERLEEVKSYFLNCPFREIKIIPKLSDVLFNLNFRPKNIQKFALRAYRWNIVDEVADKSYGIYVRDNLEGVMYTRDISEDITQLTSFYSHGNYRGIGGDLFDTFMTRAKHSRFKYVTFLMEPDAIAFYKSYEFQTYGNNEYGDTLAIIDTTDNEANIPINIINQIRKILIK